MDAVLKGIPLSDIDFLREFVRKMGWDMTLRKETSEQVKSESTDIVDRLYGCVKLPEEFDYKEELEKALKEKYL